MKTIRNTLVAATAFFLLLIGDAPPDARLGFQLVPDAHAVLGVWRRHARRWAVVGTAAVVSTASVAAAAGAADEAAAAQQPAAAPLPATGTSKHLPLGSVVSSLPGGCTSKAVDGQEYYHCGANYYRAVFQGNNLVYVTAQP